MENRDPSSTATELRQRAEQAALRQHDPDEFSANQADLPGLLHELRVQKIELQMQNTELYKSREETTSALRHFAELYDFSPVGYLTLDSDGVVQRSNVAAEVILEASSSELNGLHLKSFVWPEQLPVFRSFIDDAAQADPVQTQSASCDVDLVNKDGLVRTVHMNGHRIGKHSECCVTMTDTSDLMRAEEDLKLSEMRWQFAMESRGDAMWDWDVEKDELYLTDAAKELFGLPETGSKRPIADLMARVPDDDRIEAQGKIDDIIFGKSTEWISECRLSRPLEESCWVTTYGRVMTRTTNGSPKRIVNISHDATGRRLREAETGRQRELVAHQGRLVLLGEMASALAHEINQPLTAISGFAASCARLVAKIPEPLELTRAIEEQAIRAGEIAWRMRAFARRQRHGRVPLSIDELIVGVTKWIYMDSEYLNVTIDTTGVSSTLLEVDGDRVELEQVLVNLVRNGIEAGLPNVKIQRIAIAGQPGVQAGEIEITVTDWGRGLPNDTDFDAFKPFTSSKELGLGLGLTICFSIIEGHGGHLWATPNPEGGTVFHFTLPESGERNSG